jgi:hypothetical protein
MPTPPADPLIRDLLDQIITSAKQGRMSAAAFGIPRTLDLLAPTRKQAVDLTASGVSDRYVTTSMYLTVAKRELETDNPSDALISLEVALTIWSRWPEKRRM